jgi:signal transduction histidine kinase
MTSPAVRTARRVFWIYAAVTAAVGTTLILAPAILHLDPYATTKPFAEFAMARIWGAVLVASAATALGLAGAKDIALLQRSLRWFAFAHGFVALIVAIQQDAILESEWLTYAIGFAVSVFLLLLYAADAFSPQSVWGGRRRALHAAADAASEYDQAIREAASQEERHRLARDLHDSIKQQIFAIQTAAAAAETGLNDDSGRARDALAHVRSSAREAMTEMEAMLDQLRASPIDNAGLVAALRKLCDATGFRTDAKVVCTIGDLPPDGDVGPAVRPALLRIAQEALANVARHARATHVTVDLRTSGDDWVVSIVDDGAGFAGAKPQAGMGLRNMQSRVDDIGGTLRVASTPGGGTSIRVSTPLSAPAAPALKGWRPWNNDILPWAIGGLALALWPGKWWVDAFIGLLLIASLVKTMVHAFAGRRTQ